MVCMTFESCKLGMADKHIKTRTKRTLCTNVTIGKLIYLNERNAAAAGGGEPNKRCHFLEKPNFSWQSAGNRRWNGAGKERENHT